MNEIHTIWPADFPEQLKQIPDVPAKLYIEGTFPPAHFKLLCVVGSRKYTSYGKEVCESLIKGLKGYEIAIVSGLALGIDGIAHTAAIEAGLLTIAVPGSGIDRNILYPSSHRGLATKIIESGGCLLSEFEPDFPAAPWTFPQRNRIMSGLSHATLIIESELKSGTLITAKLGTEFNRDVGTVPGSIFSRTSEGPHMLLRLGATPICKSEDIIEMLHLSPITHDPQIEKIYTIEEKQIINLLPMSKEELFANLDMTVSTFHILISSMEIKGLIKEVRGELYKA